MGFHQSPSRTSAKSVFRPGHSAFGSSKAVIASSNPMPCLDSLAALLRRSHSNLYLQYLLNTDVKNPIVAGSNQRVNRSFSRSARTQDGVRHWYPVGGSGPILSRTDGVGLPFFRAWRFCPRPLHRVFFGIFKTDEPMNFQLRVCVDQEVL